MKEAIENNNIVFFENNELESFPWLENDIKKVSIVDDYWKKISSWKYFVYEDINNNTIEYRSLREIKIPEWFNPKQRLFLESQNQYAKTHRLENLWKTTLEKNKLVPAMQYFADKVNNILEK